MFLTTNADWAIEIVFFDAAGLPITFAGMGTYVASLKRDPTDASPLITFETGGTHPITIHRTTEDGQPADMMRLFASKSAIQNFAPGRLFGDILRTDGAVGFVYSFELPLLKGIT